MPKLRNTSGEEYEVLTAYDASGVISSAAELVASEIDATSAAERLLSPVSVTIQYEDALTRSVVELCYTLAADRRRLARARVAELLSDAQD